VALTYTPLGRDEPISQRLDLDAFRALFRLADPLAHARAAGDPLHWCAFLDEAAIEAEALIGRAAEVQQVKDWLKGRNTRIPVSGAPAASIGWLSGRPGIGKSLLMAKVAADFSDADPAHQAVYFHQFRGGDARNSPRAFALGLLAALDAWPLLPQPPADAEAGDPAAQPDDRLFETLRKRLEPIAALTAPNPRSAPPRLLVLLDGLDEVARLAPWLPARLRQLALPGTVWLLAGRPEPALQQAFSGPGCEALFPDGLPSLPAADVRAILLDGLAQSRHRLVARDQDQPDGVSNPFIDRVVAAANGLPIYVRCVVHDLLDDVYTVHDEKRLAPDWVAYLDDLIQREGVSDVVKDRTDTVALLARAEEPLEADGLALLLGALPEHASRYNDRVARVVRTSATLLRGASTPEGTPGLALYHQSLRDRVGGHPALSGQSAIPPAPYLAGSVTDAECKLCDRAANWQRLPPGNLRNHLFRWGVRYALRWEGAKGLESALARLTDFAFLQALTAELPAGDLGGLVADYGLVLDRLPHGPERDDFRLWEAFFREREHILRRGNERWPANKILLQLAVEHGDDSPLTQAAEAWLTAGHCKWVWWRNPQRPARAAPDPCIRVLDNGDRPVSGVLVVDADRVLSWAPLKLWDWRTGECLATLAGHEAANGAALLPSGRLLTWDSYRSDATLQIWNSQDGSPLLTLPHPKVWGASVLPNGNILSWDLDWQHVCLWDGRNDEPVATLSGFDIILPIGPVVLGDSRIITADRNGGSHLWCGEDGAHLRTLGAPGEGIPAIKRLDDRRVLYSNGQDHRVWDFSPDGKSFRLDCRVDFLDGLVLNDGRILAWDRSHSGIAWIFNPGSGEVLLTLLGHIQAVWGMLELPGQRALSWSADATLRLWDITTGNLIRTFAGHGDVVRGALPLADGATLVSWSNDGTLRLWDIEQGTQLAVFVGSEVISDAWLLGDGLDQCILSASNADHALRLWDARHRGFSSTLPRHAGRVTGVRALPDNDILTWSDDGTLRLWDRKTGASIRVLTGHRNNQPGSPAAVKIVECLEDGSIASAADWDECVRVWDPATGAEIGTLRRWDQGYDGPWQGAITDEGRFLVLPGSRILTWHGTTLWLWQRQGAAPRGLFGRKRRREGTADDWTFQALVGHSKEVRRTWLLSNGNILSADDSGALRLWDGTSGAPLAELGGYDNRWIDIRALADGRMLTWAQSFGSPVRMWDGASGALLWTLDGQRHAFFLDELSTGPVLTLSSDCSIRIWNTEDGTPVAACVGHTGQIGNVIGLPNARVLSWAEDGTWRLWDARDGRQIATLTSLERHIQGVWPLPDGSLLSWEYHQMRRWDSETGEPLGPAIRFEQAAWEVPIALIEKVRRDNPHAIAEGCAAFAVGSMVGIVAPPGGDDAACWHGGTRVSVHQLFDDGILTLTRQGGEVHCLQLFRGDSRITVADLHTRGLSPLERALDDADRALAAREAADSADPSAQLALAEAHANRGHALQNLGRLNEAAAAFDEALTHLERLDCSAANARRLTAIALQGRGLTRAWLDQFESALGDLDRAITLYQTLDLDAPQVMEWLATAYDARGGTYASRGELVAALDDCARALALFERLDGASTAILTSKAKLLARRGEQLRALARNAEAVDELTKAAELLETLIPSDAGLRAPLAVVYSYLANCLLRTGQVRRGIAMTAKAVSMRYDMAGLLRQRAAMSAGELQKERDKYSSDSSVMGRIERAVSTRWVLNSSLRSFRDEGMLATDLEQLERDIEQRSGHAKRRAERLRDRLCARPWYLWSREGLSAPPVRHDGRLPTESDPYWPPMRATGHWTALTGEAARPHLDGLASLLEPTGHNELLASVQTKILAMRGSTVAALDGWTACEVLIDWHGAWSVVAFLSSKEGAVLLTAGGVPLINDFCYARGIRPFSPAYLELIQLFVRKRQHYNGYIRHIRQYGKERGWRLDTDPPIRRGSRRAPWWHWVGEGQSAPPYPFPGNLPTETKTHWQPAPLVDGPWTAEVGEAARPWLDALWSLLRIHGTGDLRRRIRGDIFALRTRPMTCFPGWHLCEVQVRGRREHGSLAFLAASSGALLLHNQVWPLNDFLCSIRCRLQGAETYHDFLRFFYAFAGSSTFKISGANIAKMRLVTDADTVPWRPDANPEKLFALKRQIARPSLMHLSEDGARFLVWMSGNGELYRKGVYIPPYGRNPNLDESVNLGADDLVIDYQPRFDGPIRLTDTLQGSTAAADAAPGT
jgi:WD40 repeat protein/tetratricopeptide (TPR) repeat protein